MNTTISIDNDGSRQSKHEKKGVNNTSSKYDALKELQDIFSAQTTQNIPSYTVTNNDFGSFTDEPVSHIPLSNSNPAISSILNNNSIKTSFDDLLGGLNQVSLNSNVPMKPLEPLTPNSGSSKKNSFFFIPYLIPSSPLYNIHPVQLGTLIKAWASL